MRTILSHGVDLERLEAAAAFLTAVEILLQNEATEHENAVSDRDHKYGQQCRRDARDCVPYAQIVRDAVAALERLEDERC